MFIGIYLCMYCRGLSILLSSLVERDRDRDRVNIK